MALEEEEETAAMEEEEEMGGPEEAVPLDAATELDNSFGGDFRASHLASAIAIHTKLDKQRAVTVSVSGYVAAVPEHGKSASKLQAEVDELLKRATKVHYIVRDWLRACDSRLDLDAFFLSKMVDAFVHAHVDLSDRWRYAVMYIAAFIQAEQ